MALPAYINADTGAITDGEAWVGIAHASLSLPAATVTWTSTDDGQTGDFSQYMALVVISYTRLTGSGGGVNSEVKFNLNNNADTALYVTQQLRADGSSVTAVADTADGFGNLCQTPGSGADANDFGCSVLHLFDINSGKYKSCLSTYAADTDGAGYTGINAITWKSQAPITEIDIVNRSGSHAVGSTFSMFGILPRMVA